MSACFYGIGRMTLKVSLVSASCNFSFDKAILALNSCRWSMRALSRSRIDRVEVLAEDLLSSKCFG